MGLAMSIVESADFATVAHVPLSLSEEPSISIEMLTRALSSQYSPAVALKLFRILKGPERPLPSVSIWPLRTKQPEAPSPSLERTRVYDLHQFVGLLQEIYFVTGTTSPLESDLRTECTAGCLQN